MTAGTLPTRSCEIDVELLEWSQPHFIFHGALRSRRSLTVPTTQVAPTNEKLHIFPTPRPISIVHNLILPLCKNNASRYFYHPVLPNPI